MPQLDCLLMGSVMVEMTPVREGQALREADQLLPLPSGAGTNAAVAMRRLGVTVGIISRVGADEWGDWLLSRLAALDIDTSLISRVPDQLSPVSFAWMDRAGAKTFYFYRFPGLCDPMATLSAADIHPDWFQSVRCFDFTEAAIRREPLRSAAMRAAELSRAAGCWVVYAVNYRPSGWAGREAELVPTQRAACAAADAVVLNADEAHLITGQPDPAAAARHIAALGPKLVAVTNGEQGTVLFADGRTTHIPAFDVEVRYDIGAGDAFHAGLVAAVLRGLSPVDAVRFASAVAALKISRPPKLDYLPKWNEAARLAGLV